ncbi:ABC transporter permease [Salipaludibacillus sp. LMS25]|jgi:putative ABC transport system permease protein|uniref:ABC transporter permease n=1 Tax=Salipaludibacillus sp. LMS25 TaxID=2924031 RepID=UPI0020D1419B|nr:ABC transporter permease [Salipaludibacillus sp. LMS25]UTR15759.1 ABC transporter permease [Salipaludibacillus sp. LMS25]
MMKLAFATLLRRRRWFLLLLAMTTLSIVAVISIFTASETIKISILERNYDKHGKFHAVVVDANDEVIEKISQASFVEAVGQVNLLGTTYIDQAQTREVTVGSFDEEAVRLGRLNLVEGRMPENAGEIALEFFYAQTSDRLSALGDEAVVTIAGEKQQVEVVGIVENYIHQWPQSGETVRGINDFPNVFLSETDMAQYKEFQTNVLVTYAGHPTRVQDRFTGLDLILSSNDIEIFEHTYLFHSLYLYDSLSKATLLFQLLVLLAVTLCMLSLFSFYFQDQSQKLAIFRAYGATKKEMYQLVSCQSGLIFMISTGLALPFVLLVHHGMTAIAYDASSFLSINFHTLIVWACVLFSLILTTALIMVFLLRKRSISSLLREVKCLQMKQNKEIISNRFPWFGRQIILQIIQSWKQAFITVICIIAVIVYAVLGVYSIQQTEVLNPMEDSIEDVTYSLYSQVVHIGDTLHGFYYTSQLGSSFSPADTHLLKKTPGIAFVDNQPFMMDTQILLLDDQLTPTLRNIVVEELNQEQSFLEMEEGLLDRPSKRDLKIAEDLYAIPHNLVEYVVVDEKKYEQIYKKYFGTNGDYLAFKEKELILFVPEDEEQLQSLIGETVQFGQLRLNEDEDFQFRHWDYKVQQVYAGVFSLDITDRIEQTREAPIVIVLDHEKAIEHGLVEGYQFVSVYLDEDVTVAEKEEIESKSIDLASTVPTGIFSDWAQEEQEEKHFFSFIKIISYFMLTVTLILSAVSIGVMMFSRFMVRRQKWGLYLAAGMTRSQMRMIVFGELFVYWLLSTIISLPILFCYIKRMFDQVNPALFLANTGAVFVSGLIIFTIIGIALNRFMTSHSILSLLRVTE